MDKKYWRQHILKERNLLLPSAVSEKSAQIAQTIISSDFFKNAKTIGIFNSFGTEVDTKPIIDEGLRQNKIIALPTVVSADDKHLSFYRYDEEAAMQKGSFGIKEIQPDDERFIEPDAIDLMIMPGVVLNPLGDRIGYGAGFYDRYCKNLRPDCPLVAVVFALQVIDTQWETSSYDVKVPIIVTEESMIYTKKAPRK